MGIFIVLLIIKEAFVDSGKSEIVANISSLLKACNSIIYNYLFLF